MKVIVHEIKKDGLPSYEQTAAKVVAFISRDEVHSGKPVDHTDGSGRVCWSESDSLFDKTEEGVTHWLEFPCPIDNIKGLADPPEQPEQEDAQKPHKEDLKYSVVERYNLDALCYAINTSIKVGWLPQGGIHTNVDGHNLMVYLQALTRPK